MLQRILPALSKVSTHLRVPRGNMALPQTSSAKAFHSLTGDKFKRYTRGFYTEYIFGFIDKNRAWFNGSIESFPTQAQFMEFMRQVDESSPTSASLSIHLDAFLDYYLLLPESVRKGAKVTEIAFIAPKSALLKITQSASALPGNMFNSKEASLFFNLEKRKSFVAETISAYLLHLLKNCYSAAQMQEARYLFRELKILDEIVDAKKFQDFFVQFERSYNGALFANNLNLKQIVKLMATGKTGPETSKAVAEFCAAHADFPYYGSKYREELQFEFIKVRDGFQNMLVSAPPEVQLFIEKTEAQFACSTAKDESDFLEDMYSNSGRFRNLRFNPYPFAREAFLNFSDADKNLQVNQKYQRWEPVLQYPEFQENLISTYAYYLYKHIQTSNQTALPTAATKAELEAICKRFKTHNPSLAEVEAGVFAELEGSRPYPEKALQKLSAELESLKAAFESGPAKGPEAVDATNEFESPVSDVPQYGC